MPRARRGYTRPRAHTCGFKCIRCLRVPTACSICSTQSSTWTSTTLAYGQCLSFPSHSCFVILTVSNSNPIGRYSTIKCSAKPPSYVPVSETVSVHLSITGTMATSIRDSRCGTNLVRGMSGFARHGGLMGLEGQR
jgi:hypothetical protein